MSEERTVNGAGDGERLQSNAVVRSREEPRGRGWTVAAVSAGAVWAILYIAAMLRIPYDGKECLVEDALMMLAYWVGVVLVVVPLSALAVLAGWKLRPGARGKAMGVAGMCFFVTTCVWGVPKLELWARMKMREARKTKFHDVENVNLGSMPCDFLMSGDSSCGGGSRGQRGQGF